MKYDWSRLNHLQVGQYAEYFVKMEFTLHGFDVYTAEVDDKGIDFIVRRDDESYFDIQVKSLRESGYVFMRKSIFRPRRNLLAAIVVFRQSHPPDLFLVPSLVWSEPDGVFVGRDYEGLKSKPEWGINVSRKNWSRLEAYAFDKVIPALHE